MLNRLICWFIGHKKKYSTYKGFIGYSERCARCKQNMFKVVKKVKLQ